MLWLMLMLMLELSDLFGLRSICRIAAAREVLRVRAISWSGPRCASASSAALV